LPELKLQSSSFLAMKIMQNF